MTWSLCSKSLWIKCQIIRKYNLSGEAESCAVDNGAVVQTLFDSRMSAEEMLDPTMSIPTSHLNMSTACLTSQPCSKDCQYNTHPHLP